MVSEKGGHVKVMRALATVLIFTSTLQAQNPTTEQEWRSELVIRQNSLPLLIR